MYATFAECDSMPHQEGDGREAFSPALYYEDVFTVTGVVIDPTCCNALSTASSCCPGAVHPASVPFHDETKPLWNRLLGLVISNRKRCWGSGVHSC